VNFRALVLALVLAGAAVPALRGQDPFEGKWWKRPGIALKIGLTVEQQDQIEKIFVRSRTKLIDLRADLEKKQLLLGEAMQDKSAERSDVEKKIEAVENARAELQKTRALMLLDIRQVLHPEQWEHLMQMQQNAREARERLRQRIRERMQEERERAPAERKLPPESKQQ
jgi:Spy/CpxP family protein refolding chaperone